MRAAIRNRQWTASLIVSNLANTRKISGAGYLNNDNYVTGTQQLNITDLRPRTITLGLDYAF
jgi:outer membrane receptor protein involved in Fe transport